MALDHAGDPGRVQGVEIRILARHANVELPVAMVFGLRGGGSVGSHGVFARALKGRGDGR